MLRPGTSLLGGFLYRTLPLNPRGDLTHSQAERTSLSAAPFPNIRLAKAGSCWGMGVPGASSVLLLERFLSLAPKGALWSAKV